MQLEELNDTHIDSLLALGSEAQPLFGTDLSDRISLSRFIKQCSKEKMDWRPKAGQVSLTHYVLMENREVCGYGRLRFPVEIDGELGNLEFFVPPSKRKRGFGTHTLNRLLFEAVRAGLARALVVCRADNPAAIRCILYNRGEKIEDADSEWARFWIRFR